MVNTSDVLAAPACRGGVTKTITRRCPLVRKNKNSDNAAAANKLPSSVLVVALAYASGNNFVVGSGACVGVIVGVGAIV